MAQILKESIRASILASASAEFARDGYQSASMRSIARGAGISPGLIYTYYESKEALLDAVLAPVLFDWEAVLAEEDSAHPQANSLSQAELDCLCRLIEHPLASVTLMEGCAGTKYAHAKESLTAAIEAHLLRHSRRDALFVHIVASGFVDGVIQIIRHNQGREWAVDMLRQLSDMYFQGIG